MKKLLISLLIATSLVGCASTKVLDGKEYPPYGLINRAWQKSDDVCYNVRPDYVYYEAVAWTVFPFHMPFIWFTNYYEADHVKQAEETCP